MVNGYKQRQRAREKERDREKGGKKFENTSTVGSYTAEDIKLI